MQRHKIITRGLTPPGGRHRLVARGFAISNFIQPILEKIKVVLHGRSRKREEIICDEFYIKASLIAVNKNELLHPITGKLKIETKKEIGFTFKVSKYITAKIINVWNSIFIKATRIK